MRSMRFLDLTKNGSLRRWDIVEITVRGNE